ncbi:hypothetical protein BU16DRAFT_584787 [Lophium mytilinum]|uniref:Uncharacterized protein n=1 Tax=Lophium mytilinum TaxID=390894 RepID=A0A6A6QH37_9PEZI|nr:hypothetical protein BU16DRAFT_584787 [Lophium mytilinum]
MAAAVRLPSQTNHKLVGLGITSSPPPKARPLQPIHNRSPRDPRGYVSPGQERLDRRNRRSSIPIRTTTPHKPRSTLPRTMITPATPELVKRSPTPSNHYRLPPTPPPKDNMLSTTSVKSTIRHVPSTDSFHTSITRAFDEVDGTLPSDSIASTSATTNNNIPPHRTASLSSIRPVSAIKPHESDYNYKYPEAKALPPSHMPKSWNAQHDRYICVADARGDTLGEIAQALRVKFPDIGMPISMGLVDKRLRTLDMRHEGYWKEGLGTAEEGESGYESGVSSVAAKLNGGTGEKGKERASDDRSGSCGSEGKRRSSGLPVPVGSKVARRSLPPRASLSSDRKN